MDPKEYNFIETYDDAFHLSDFTIDYFESKKQFHKERSQGEKLNGIDDTFMFLEYDSKDKDLQKILNESYNSIKNCFDLFCDKYRETYLNEFKNFKNYIITDYKIQKTLPGQGFSQWHYEKGKGEIFVDENGNSINNPRKEYGRFLVYTIYLNDVLEGGETSFLYQNIKIKPKKGTVCLFPADYTHVHKGISPKKEVKYIMTGWLNDSFMEF